MMPSPATQGPCLFPRKQGSGARTHLQGPGLGNRGSALLAAICFAAVLAIAVSSYLTLCLRTLELSTRSVQGTRSVQLAESGLEEALWALNKNNWAGWTITGSTATKTVAGVAFDGGAVGSISLRVSSYDGSAGPRTVRASGTVASPDGAGNSRTLTATSARAPLFVNAVAATTSRVRFRNAGMVDSYDSKLGDYSAQTPGFSAVLCSSSTSTTSATVQLNRAQVKGYVATRSTGPSYSTGGKLIGPTTPAVTFVDAGRISTSPYQPLFEESKPTGAGATLPSGTATIGTPGATVEAVYYATNVNLTGAQVLTVDGPAALVISGDLYIADSARIRITTNGALRIHLGGDLGIGGGGIQNDTKLPKNLFIVSTTNPYDTFSMATNTPFHGAIYTPVSSLTIANSQEIFGALVAKSVTFSASPEIHYDVDLRRTIFNGIDSPFAAANVSETSTP